MVDQDAVAAVLSSEEHVPVGSFTDALVHYENRRKRDREIKDLIMTAVEQELSLGGDAGSVANAVLEALFYEKYKIVGGPVRRSEQ